MGGEYFIMKILICGAYDGLVEALRKKGHEAYTCYRAGWSKPIRAEWHIQRDPFSGILDGGCFITAAGAEHWLEKWDLIFLPDRLLIPYVIMDPRDNVFVLPDNVEKLVEVIQ